MNSVTFALNGNELTVKLSGKVDSSNSAQTEQEINTLLEANTHTSLIFDIEELDYISSAGLRVLLRTRKNEPSLKIINAKPDVYEVLEMTGFTDLMSVEKAFRRINVEGCELIGKGFTGKVYRLDPETIVKCYFKKDALNEIRREREFARKAFILGIPTAISYDIVRVDDGYGSVFELLNADTFVNLIKKHPENIDTYAALSVDVLKQLHSKTVDPDEFPDKREIGIRWAEVAAQFLPCSYAQKLVSLFVNIGESNTLLHGDYHIKNIMMQKDEVLLIDMDTLCRGNIVFEFAAIYNAYIAYGDLNADNSMEFFGVSGEITKYLFNKTLELYLGTKDENIISAAYKKSALVGYTEMVMTFAQEDANSPAAKHYINELIKLLDETDSLAF